MHNDLERWRESILLCFFGDNNDRDNDFSNDYKHRISIHILYLPSFKCYSFLFRTSCRRSSIHNVIHRLLFRIDLLDCGESWCHCKLLRFSDFSFVFDIDIYSLNHEQ